MTLPALYELAGEYREAADKLQQLDLPDDVVRDTLEGLAGDLETKSTNVALFVRNLEAVAEKMIEAEANIAQRRAAVETRAKRIRQYLKEQMERAGITKIESPYLALTIKKNPPKVEIVNAELIPDELKKIPPVPMPTPDLKAIKEAIDNGEQVPGASKTQGTRLEIK